MNDMRSPKLPKRCRYMQVRVAGKMRLATKQLLPHTHAHRKFFKLGEANENQNLALEYFSSIELLNSHPTDNPNIKSFKITITSPGC